MPRKTRTKAHSTNILDYSSMMSLYEKDSLASDARLAADRKKDKPERLNSHAGQSISEQLCRESEELLATESRLINDAATLKVQAADLQKQISKVERNFKKSRKTSAL
jgi:hypothetical protein